MLLYDVVDFEPTSLTMKKDGTSLTSQLNDSAADSTSVPSTTSISDPVQIVKKKEPMLGSPLIGSNCRWGRTNTVLLGV